MIIMMMIIIMKMMVIMMVTNSVFVCMFQLVDHAMAGIEDITGYHGHHLMRER